jgi:hypothetical protein
MEEDLEDTIDQFPESRMEGFERGWVMVKAEDGFLPAQERQREEGRIPACAGMTEEKALSFP